MPAKRKKKKAAKARKRTRKTKGRKVAKRARKAKRKVSRKAKRKVSKKAKRKVRRAKKKAVKRPKRKAKAKKAKAKKTRRKKRKASAAFMMALTPSAALASVVGAKPLPRTQVIKKLWAYIKKNGLQDKKDRRMINADALLLPIFGGRRQVSMFQMMALVSKHLK